MTARYELRSHGVWDREQDRLITRGAPGWSEYQASLARGEHPDPHPVDWGSIERRRAERCAEVNARRTRAIAAGVAFEGYVYDSDSTSLANVTAAVAGAAAGIPIPEGFTWRTADNVNVPMDVEQLVALGAAMLAHGSACYAYSWALKDAINDSDDPLSINLDEGWPT